MQLTNTEYEDLVRLESAIESGRKYWVSAGRALLEVQSRQLFRATHADFWEYCEARWGWKRRNASYVIESAAIYDALPEGLQNFAESASQARELAKVKPEKRAELLEQVAAAGPVTAKAIKAAAKPKPKPEPEPMSLPAHPAPVREDAETRKVRMSGRIQSFRDDLKGFLAAQNPTRAELVAAAVSLRTLAKELDNAAANLAQQP